ncbi:MAG: hypothetical protein K9I84_03675 [Leadbetterella sp.]|nr:hypothetical protein [Leadbetterella sp.]
MKNFKLILVFTIIAAFLLASCAKEKSYSYEVTGTSGSYSVTLQNADDNTQQWANVGNGWTYKWSQQGKRWLYVSAQNNRSSGNVTVRILINGKIIAENTSVGGYTIATVSGDY